jgi:hypothetical protein
MQLARLNSASGGNDFQPYTSRMALHRARVVNESNHPSPRSQQASPSIPRTITSNNSQPSIKVKFRSTFHNCVRSYPAESTNSACGQAALVV